MFTWGYWGWGNATEHLVSLVDSVEHERGFAPPIFVDIRIRRTVRDIGFQGNAFGDRLGGERYVHMPDLGNLKILGRPGPAVQIKDERKAADLLHVAINGARTKRRVILFCACEYPGIEGHQNACHRATVVGLVLTCAKRKGIALELGEWPGGEMKCSDLALPPGEAKLLLRGRKSISLGKQMPGADVANLAPGSVVRFGSASGHYAVMVGGVRFGSGVWYLPVLSAPASGEAGMHDLISEVRDWRRKHGFEPRRTT